MQTDTPEAAEAQARAALRAGDAAAAPLLVRALMHQGEFAAALPLAIEHHERVRRADLASWHLAVGDLVLCCAQLGLAGLGADAVEAFRVALAKSRHPHEHAWPGRWLSRLAMPEAALQAHLEALQRFPGAPFLEAEAGWCELALGRPSGLRRSRHFALPGFWTSYYPGVAPVERMWQGEALEGRSLLVLQHGGVGDAIQFVRYAPVLRAMGVRDLALCSPHRSVEGLLGSMPGVRVVPAGAPVDVDGFDHWTSTFGLFLHLAAEHGLRCAEGPYLRPPPSALCDKLLRHARSRAQGKPLIGLWWHSDAQDGLAKSVPLPALLPLWGLGSVHWLIFQRGMGLRQLQACGLDIPTTVLPDTLGFDAQAAIMQGLDGMAAIDSFALHMAGAVGCPSWHLAARALDWRYLDAEQVSPLYPRARICRQPRLGDWRSAVRQLAVELAALG